MKPATAKTLSLLQERGNAGLSTLELRAEGINAPSARVGELKSAYEIDSRLCWSVDQQGFSRKVSRYFFIGQKQ